MLQLFTEPVQELSDYQYASSKRKFCKIVRWMLMSGERNLMTIDMETAEALNALVFKGKACFQSLTHFDKRGAAKDEN